MESIKDNLTEEQPLSVVGVTVKAPARVHFGLLQMSQAYASSFMGVGSAISKPSWSLFLAENGIGVDRFQDLPVELVEYATNVLRRLRLIAAFPTLNVQARQSVPLHVGLGAKTSFACALLAGVVTLFEFPGTWPEYRHVLHRAGAGGVGINTAVNGGTVLDAGHKKSDVDELLPSSARSGYPVPALISAWQTDFLPPLVLARPPRLQGLSGASEAQFFRDQLPLSQDEVRSVAAIGLYELLPALTRRDGDGVIEALSSMQDVGFKRVEWSAQPESVFKLRNFALAQGATAVVLSSMGPTLAIFSDAPIALCRRIRVECQADAIVSAVQDGGLGVELVVAASRLNRVNLSMCQDRSLKGKRA